MAGALVLGSMCLNTVACVSVEDRQTYYYNATKPASADEYGAYLAARYAGLVRDGRSAAEYYSQALEQTPEDIALLERAIIYALVAGDTELALELATNAPSNAKQEGMAAMLVAVDHFKKGQFKKVSAFTNQENTGAIQDIIAKSLRDWSQIELKNKDIVLPVSHSEREARLFQGVQRYSDGLLQSANGQDEDALVSFEQAWSLGGRYPVGVDAYARLTAEMGDIEAAKGIVSQFFEQIGDNPLIDQLDRDLRAGKSLVAPRPSAQQGAAASVLGYALAIAAKQGGDYANLYYSIVLMLDNEQDAARLLLADSMRSAERQNDAIAQLHLITAGSVYFGAARVREAWALYDLGEEARAIELAKSALEAKPGRSLKMQIGDLYRTLNMFDDAESLFDTVVKEDLKDGFIDWRVLFARATMRDKLNQWNAAEADLLAALNYAPERPEILNYLGYSWIDRGKNIDEAFGMIQRAMAQRPDEGYIRDSLGWAYYRLNQYEKAVKFLEEAAELEPSDPVINDHLGDAYWRIGRIEQAQYQWSRVVEYSDDNELTQIAQKKLKVGLDAHIPVVFKP